MKVPISEHLGWKLDCITVGPLEMNAWIIYSSEENSAILVDPGDEPNVLLRAIDATKCELKSIICTHGHFDHIGATAAIQKNWNLPLLAHEDGKPLIETMQSIQSTYGFPRTEDPDVEYFSGESSLLKLGSLSIELIHTPGHCPGHIIIKLPENVIVGDLIFARSVGRTDLPGGSFPTLENSIRTALYTLDEETALHPGHGPSTSVGEEMEHNPFVR